MSATEEAPKATAEDHKAAVRAAMEKEPEDGAKTIAKKLKEEAGIDINFQKVKKMMSQVKQDIEDEKAAKKALVQKMVDDFKKLKARQGTKDNCPLEHGLSLHRTNHSGFCCDVCRCYVPTNTEMRGCRHCDWDVCLKCAPVNKTTIEDLRRRFQFIESRVEEKKDDRTGLAQVESELHRMDREVDNFTAQELADNSILTVSADEMRASKKQLVRAMEGLQAKIDDIFVVLKPSQKSEAAEPKAEGA